MLSKGKNSQEFFIISKLLFQNHLILPARLEDIGRAGLPYMVFVSHNSLDSVRVSNEYEDSSVVVFIFSLSQIHNTSQLYDKYKYNEFNTSNNNE